MLLPGLLLLLILPRGPILATDYSTSTSFIIRDPVIDLGGDLSNSSAGTFQIHSSIGQNVQGEASSLTSFTQRAGFQYYPLLTSPTITPTAGDAQVSLSWTAAVAQLGFSVSQYRVQRATVSGGPYGNPATSAGTSLTVSSLVNGTTYYFVVEVLDSYGAVIGTSAEISSAPVASASPTPAPSGGGGPVGVVIKKLIDFIFPTPTLSGCPPVDLNGDCAVDIVDLSILLYYFDRPFPEQVDFNKDEAVDIIDISVLFFYWTR